MEPSRDEAEATGGHRALHVLLLAVLSAAAAFGTDRLLSLRDAQVERDATEREASTAARTARQKSLFADAVNDAFAFQWRRPHGALIEARLAAAWRAVGILPDGTPFDEAAAKLHALGFGDDLAPPLDEWAALRRVDGDRPGAQRLLDLANKLDDDSTRRRIRRFAQEGAGLDLAELGRSPEAEQWPPVTTILLGQGLLEVGSCGAATRLLERAVRRAPSHFGLRLALADACFAQGPPAAPYGLAQYTAALALDPTSVRAAARLACLLFDQLGQPSAAVAAMDAACRRDPESAPLACVYGSALLAARHVEEAKSWFEKALALDPGSALAEAGLGEACNERDEPLKGRDHFVKSLTLADTPEARDGLANSLRALRRRREAFVALEDGVRRHPRDALLRDHFATVLVERGRFAEGLAHLKEAVRLDEWIAEVQNDYAWELVNSGDPKLRRPGQALAYTHRAVELAPDSSWYRNTLGVAYYRLGDYSRAADVLETACDMPRGGGPYDLFFLAMAKHELGERSEARDLLVRATELTEQLDEGNDELVRLRAEAEALLGGAEDGS